MSIDEQLRDYFMTHGIEYSVEELVMMESTFPIKIHYGSYQRKDYVTIELPDRSQITLSRGINKLYSYTEGWNP